MTLDELLTIGPLKGAIVLTGGQSLHCEVGDIAVMEVPDIEDYVKKDDFLLTTFFPIHKDPQRLERIIPALHRLGLCGIGIKSNRYLGRIPDKMLEQANELGFPIVAVPENVNFSDVITNYLRDKLRIRNSELEYRDSLHSITMEMLMQGYGFQELADTIQKTMGRNVLLLSSDGLSLTPNEGELIGEEDFALLTQAVGALAPGNHIQSVFVGHIEWFIFPVVHGFHTTGYILLEGVGEPLREADRITIEQYAAVFTVIRQKNLSIVELEKRYSNEFAYDLLLREPPTLATAVNRARTIGWHLSFPSVVVVVEMPVRGQDDYSYRDQFAIRLRHEALLRYGVGHEQFFIANIGDEITLLLNREAVKKQSELVDLIYQCANRNAEQQYFIGVSNPVSQMNLFQRRFHEGQKAIQIARLIGHTRPLCFRDAGIYRVLHHQHIRDELLSFCKDTIGAVIQYDNSHNSNYLETMETIFTCEGNYKKAAAALYLHYNTLRYRVRVIAELLGIEPASLHFRQDIYLAVKAYKLFDEAV